jgi:invasion protein IalB
MRIRALATVMLAGVLTAAFATSPAATAAQTPPDHFAVVLEHSTTGWTAHCETGCRWTDLSMSCAGCDVRLDASGIAHASSAPSKVTGFAFVLSDAKGGWTARGVHGVMWTSLSWTCGPTVCRGRLDESGVGRA